MTLYSHYFARVRSFVRSFVFHNYSLAYFQLYRYLLETRIGAEVVRSFRL